MTAGRSSEASCSCSSSSSSSSSAVRARGRSRGRARGRLISSGTSHRCGGHGVESGRLSEALRDRPDATALAVERDATHLDRAEELFFATLRAGLPNEAFQAYVRTLGGFPQLGLRSGAMARGARLMAALAAGGEPANVDARLIPDFRAAAAYDRGLYAGALGDLELAERCYVAFEAIAVETQGDSAVAESVLASRARAYTARLAGSLRVALRHIERSVALAAEHGLESHLVRSVSLEASIRHDLGDTEGAAKGFARARELEGEPEARRALWEAEHHLDLGRRDQARALAERVVEQCEGRHWSGHVAHARTLLGAVALAAKKADLAAARAHVDAARPWADASGEVEMILRVRALATRLALAERDEPRAAAEAQRGLDVARSCGFRLAERRLAALYRLTGSSRRCLSARKRRR